MPCADPRTLPDEITYFNYMELFKLCGITFPSLSEKSKMWDEFHPTTTSLGKSVLDEFANILCKYCKDSDMQKAPLELKLWWTEHQHYDQLRNNQELK